MCDCVTLTEFTANTVIDGIHVAQSENITLTGNGSSGSPLTANTNPVIVQTGVTLTSTTVNPGGDTIWFDSTADPLRPQWDTEGSIALLSDIPTYTPIAGTLTPTASANYPTAPIPYKGFIDNLNHEVHMILGPVVQTYTGTATSTTAIAISNLLPANMRPANTVGASMSMQAAVNGTTVVATGNALIQMKVDSAGSVGFLIDPPYCWDATNASSGSFIEQTLIYSLV